MAACPGSSRMRPNPGGRTPGLAGGGPYSKLSERCAFSDFPSDPPPPIRTDWRRRKMALPDERQTQDRAAEFVETAGAKAKRRVAGIRLHRLSRLPFNGRGDRLPVLSD